MGLQSSFLIKSFDYFIAPTALCRSAGNRGNQGNFIAGDGLADAGNSKFN